MGRPSKLSPDQWREIDNRLSAGERATDLAKEFQISACRISERIAKVSKPVHVAAAKLADAHNSLASLPIAQQYQALNLAEKLRNISTSLAHAAENGAATAHRLSAIANLQAQKIDEASPMESQESLQAISALTKIANDAASLGLGLVNANKTGKEPNTPEMPTLDISKISSQTRRELIEARL
jgi:hypothetical protein